MSSAPTDDDADSDFIAQALPAFISEAHEQIESIEQLMLELEDTPGDRDLLDALFRCAHTVKGSAGIFGLDAVVGFTHHVETLLDHLRDGKLMLSPELSTLLLRCNDQIRILVDGAANGEAADEAGEAERALLVDELALAMGQGERGGQPPAEPEPPVSVASKASAASAASAGQGWALRAAFGADTFRNGMDPLAILHYLGGMGQLGEVICDFDALPLLEAIDPESCHLAFDFSLHTEAGREAVEAAFSFVRDDCALEIEALVPDAVLPTGADASMSAKAAAPALPGPTAGPVAVAATGAASRAARNRDATAPEDQRFIRVQADRLDEVINLLGELVIASAGASLLARQTRQGTLIEANLQITQLVEDIRNGTLKLRMVPIGETFSRFRRVVRDTAAELGKQVVLEIVGGDTELDKSVVERIADPLMHLVRNALDHGLEPPAERVAAGKPPQGRITMSACHESGNILIRITEDGRGIDRERVLARAWERGLVEPGVRPDDAAILELLFEPGFSTAEKVTNLSGRGVGMDVVRRNIEALRGSVTLDSTPGRGAEVEIRLPLTLAIIDGFLVGVGGSRFIFPLDAVVEVIESRSTAAPVDAHGRGVVELRGQVLPVVDLRALYALDSPPPERSSVVVIRASGRRYGVVVDQLLGQHQTVIKPLGRMFRSLRGMSGSSILGNGEVALIFDVHSLCQLAATRAPQSSPTHRAADRLAPAAP
jgi:two-component system, chemotaxis family, sensor kinase CheA